ncbi:Transcription factor [Coemansia spiralis]|uniref:Transcription factor n=2 Tax=Coemansia TaxID=4863 RepID=A0A9W8KYE3_9FUNG|nr:Transcription factor [Coemansia umbellata]KAJ2621674.1 Transcription factor [Coemansia sp. RSA 1358]KAJ2676821.1 Transcription factor [Coemansia spiralis]
MSEPPSRSNSISELSTSKKKTGTGRAKRQKVSKACVFCQRSHMSCNDQRPCQRCIKRNISHLCRDKEPTSDSADTRKAAKAADKESSARSVKRELDVVPIAPAVRTVVAADNPAANGSTDNTPISTMPANATANATANSLAATVATTSVTNAQTLAIVDSNVLPIIASAHSGVLSVGATSASMPLGACAEGSTGVSTTELPQPFVTDANGSTQNISVQSPGGVSTMSQIPMQQQPQLQPQPQLIRGTGSGTVNINRELNVGSRMYNGPRFDSNTLLSFGNDVASNEFSALNEFLESLQRGIRGFEHVDSDLHISNPPSGSPSEPPSVRAVNSPLTEQLILGNPLVNSSNIQPSAQFQQQFASAPGNTNNNSGGGGSGIRTSMSTSNMVNHGHQGNQHQERTHSLPTISQLMTNTKGEGVTQAERFLLTAADPNDGTSEDKLRQIINAKYEAGILKPYNYVSGYTRMQKFMETNISKQNIIRILDVLNTFRPTFRSIAQSLTDIDLLLVEEGFERLLLDYDNVFNAFGVPACLWRRTGEIYKANREFADLVGVPLSYFHDGKVCIYELLTENSTVNYWEKYGEIAFDATQKAVLTSCVLQTAASVRTLVHSRSSNKQLGDSRAMSSSSIALRIGGMADQPLPSQPGRPVRCCFSFTLRRDKYKIPLAIVGNFMPIQQ